MEHCQNCGATLHGKFCAACGQKVAAPNPTMHEVGHELVHEITHLDGRLGRTLKLLFIRPGFLTREYWVGRRASYIGPVRLYLVFSLVFYATVTLEPPRVSVREDARLGTVVNIGGLNVSGDSLLRGRAPEQLAEIVRRTDHDWRPKLMILSVPLYAVLLMAFTRREKRRFPSHMIFALHTQSAIFGVATLIWLLALLPKPVPAAWLSLASILFGALYTLRAMHAAYGGGWGRTLARAVGVLVPYWVVVTAGVVVLYVLALRA